MIVTMETTLMPSPWTAVDLSDRFGPMPLDRILFDPRPGSATEKDVLDIYQREKRLCELVDGVLVEKTAGLRESALACTLIQYLRTFVSGKKVGIVTGADGMMRLAPGLVRIPDVSFLFWEHFPNRQLPLEPIPGVFPDLAVEVLSSSNTAQEMARKRRDYFTAGTRLVWEVDPGRRTVMVYTAPEEFTVLHEQDTLDGGTVLPGFTLPLRQLFAELDPQ
jgi:Uma2 family endonuclease